MERRWRLRLRLRRIRSQGHDGREVGRVGLRMLVGEAVAEGTALAEVNGDKLGNDAVGQVVRWV